MALETSNRDPSQVLVERTRRETTTAPSEPASDETSHEKRSSWIADVVARVIEFFFSVVVR